MHRLLRAGILITFGILSIGIIGGCGDDNPTEKVVKPSQPEDDVQSRPTITVMVDPPPGSDAAFFSNTEFTLTFNQEVVAVWLNDWPAWGSGLNWKVSPVLEARHGQTLNIKWQNQDGSMDIIEVGPYSIFEDDGGEPPAITHSTVTEGAIDVDPAPINAGGFRFDFDQDVIGALKLTDEAGADLNWIGNVVGRTATLTPVAGQELVNGTTYMIEIGVVGGGGTPLETLITFVTKPK